MRSVDRRWVLVPLACALGFACATEDQGMDSGGAGKPNNGSAGSSSGGTSGAASGGNSAQAGTSGSAPTAGSGGGGAVGGGSAGGGTGGSGTAGGGSGGVSSGGSSGNIGAGGEGGSSVAPTCEDGDKNGNETDVDCGGSCAPTSKCEVDEGCSAGGDCQTGVCDTVCQPPECNDQVKNGTEAYVDCGGDVCDDCVLTLDRFVLGAGPGVSATVGMTWDATNLYFAFTVADATPQDDSTDIWEDDSVEIYLDLNNAKAGAYQSDDFQITVGRAGGTPTGQGSANYAAMTVTPGTTEGGYTLGITVPWSALGAGGAAPLGELIGFNLAVNDDTAGGARDAQLMLFGTAEDWDNPAAWGEIELN